MINQVLRFWWNREQRQRLALLMLQVCVVGRAAGASLRGATSQPNYSVFVRGEPITLTFSAEGLKPNATGLSLAVTVADVSGQVLLRKELPVAADANGKWTSTLPAPNQRLGYYHVTARLSSGEELPALGSRAAGYLSYMVLVDPKERVQPGEEAHFGMQGGFTTALDARPYLGIHWVLGGYRWGIEEPDRPGQFAEGRRRLHTDDRAVRVRESERKLGILPLPTLLNGTPKWAVTEGKLVYTTGVIKELDAWRDYCREVGRAAREDYPHLKRHVFQITWEPVYPWGFPGTDEDLIRAYMVAYPALHETDPAAFVIGPTGAGISPGDLAWNERLLKKGLWRYLDGYSIHPYIAQPPETHNLVGNVRALKEMIRTCVGRDLDLYGTEQGFPTGGDQAKELSQALWLIRSYLIMLGEGFKVNVAFYFADYPGEPGYGFFHNLNIEKVPWGTDSVSPKPVAAAFAALTMLLEGHKSVGPIEWLGPTALGYALQREGKVTLALWDWGSSSSAVRMPVGVTSVELLDWMGNSTTVRTPGGTLQLTLGCAPQYVRGVSPTLWGAAAKRPLVIEPASPTAFPGDQVRLVARVAALSGKPMRASLRVEPPESLAMPTTLQPLALGPGEPKSFPLQLALPPDADFGAFPVKVTLEQKGKLLGVSTAMLRVREPVAVEHIRPAGTSSVVVAIRNYRKRAAQGTARIHLRGVPETQREMPFALVPSGTTTLVADFSRASLEPSRVYSAQVTLSDKSGVTVCGTYQATFANALRLPSAPTIDGDLADWKSIPAMPLKGRERVVRQPQLYRGAQDLSAGLKYAWDDQALYFAAVVTDDVFLQEKTGWATWQQDSLQLAFDTQPGKVVSGAGNVLAVAGQRTNSEVDLALTKAGPEAYRTITPNEARLPIGLIGPTHLVLAVTKRAETISYEAAIPWTTLGATGPLQPGSVLGIAAAVNDADDPKQLDPKALGLFGGITPTKDPAQFGMMVLRAQAATQAPTLHAEGAPALRLHGFLGQSECSVQSGFPASRYAVIPWTGCIGAMADAKGKLWTIAGDRAYRFASGKLEASVSLPTGIRAMRGDGQRMLCLSHDDRFYAFDVGTEKAVLLAEAKLSDGKGPCDIALAPKGDFYALSHDGGVYGWASDGEAKGELLRLTPGKDRSYCSIGVDPQTGDFLIGSYWPDDKVYRVNATGKPLATHETGSGYAAMLTTFEAGAWCLSVAGRALPVMKGASRRSSVSGEWAYYPTGLSAASDGGTWIACAQGLLYFDRRGHPTGKRIGGMADPGLVAAGPDGTVLVLLENNQRFARLYADDSPEAPFASNANEPWRVGNGWTHRAAGLAWDGAGYLVLDAVAKCLWRFDPDHTAWGEKPWVRLTKEGAFQNPRALAVADALAFVLDGDSLVEMALSAPDQRSVPVVLPPSVKPSDLTALAADSEARLYAATAKQVVALTHRGQERWKTGESFGGIVSLIVANGTVLVADRARRQIIALNTGNGQVLASLDAGQVPGEFEPTCLTASGKWAFVADAAGKRLVRLQLE